MKRVFSAFVLSAALCTTPVFAGAEDAPKPKKEGPAKAGWSDKEGVKEHVLKHVKYPATRADLIKACNGMADVPQEDKDKFAKKLPDKTYNSPEEVLKALGEK